MKDKELDPVTTLYGFVGTSISVLSGLVAFFGKRMLADIGDLKKRSDECEKDRLELWKRLGEANALKCEHNKASQ